MLEREKETLDFRALMPVAIGESGNFCAIEALRRITLPEGGDSAVGTRRQILESLEAAQILRSDAESAKSLASRVGGPALARKSSSPAWITFARESKLVAGLPASANSAGDWLSVLDRAHPVLKELADAAAARPQAQFLPAPQERNLPPLLYNIPKEYFKGIEHACQALRLRAGLAQDADIRAAVDSSLAILRFSQAHSQEPGAINLLMSVSFHRIAQEAIWNLLEGRKLGDNELSILQTSLLQLDFLQAELRAMRAELSMGINALEQMQKEPYPVESFVALMGATKSSWLRKAARVIPGEALINQNKAVFARLVYESFIQPLKEQEVSFPRLRAQKEKAFDELGSHAGPLHPAYAFSAYQMHTLFALTGLVYAGEVSRRQAMLGCALERYFIQHHAYPADLSELVPAFIGGVPADPIDGQPMRYRQTSMGRYVLWSLGPDQKNDGGEVKVLAADLPVFNKLYKPGYQGDWAWQYEEVKGTK